MRALLVLLHRWFGLFIAGFLALSGLTGAVISWDHALDAWLNPTLYHAATAGAPQPPLQLAQQLETADPRVQITFLPLALAPGEALQLRVGPRPGTGVTAAALGFNQLALDPATGAEQGRRQWGEISLARENLLPFLYKLHYSLHIPDGLGLELGVLFMGIVALVWVVDTAVALVISFPSRHTWRKSFAFRWRDGGYRLHFDLHRSGGVWVWLLLLIVAVTSVSMNLNTQVVRPLVAYFAPLSPSPFAQRVAQPPAAQTGPRVSREHVVASAVAEARRRGWQDAPGGLFYSPEFDVYGVGFYPPERAHGDGGLGNAWLYFDGRTGHAAGDNVPGQGSWGDVFLQAQFPLHSGRILGLPGRVLISLLGLVVFMLSLTGIVIWSRKRRARRWRA